MFEPLELSLSLAGHDQVSAGPIDVRSLIAYGGAAGYRLVQLDGVMKGLRARELGRSGRRDLAAILRRSGLDCSGIDLWIPPAHFTDPARVDRAAAAVVDAIELLADLVRLARGTAGPSGGQRGVVSLTLPPNVQPPLITQMAQRAETCGVVIADHAWVPAPAAESRAGADGLLPPAAAGGGAGPIGRGIDPAMILAAGGDPASEASRLGAAPQRLVSARLSDWSGAARVAPGSADGRLDLVAYAAALAAAGELFARAVVVDLRGVPGGLSHSAEVRARWTAVHQPWRGGVGT